MSEPKNEKFHCDGGDVKTMQQKDRRREDVKTIEQPAPAETSGLPGNDDAKEA